MEQGRHKLTNASPAQSASTHDAFFEQHFIAPARSSAASRRRREGAATSSIFAGVDPRRDQPASCRHTPSRRARPRRRPQLPPAGRGRLPGQRRVARIARPRARAGHSTQAGTRRPNRPRPIAEQAAPRDSPARRREPPTMPRQRGTRSRVEAGDHRAHDAAVSSAVGVSVERGAQVLRRLAVQTRRQRRALTVADAALTHVGRPGVDHRIRRRADQGAVGRRVEVEQAAEEGDDQAQASPSVRVRRRPRRHAGELDAVRHDVEQLAPCAGARQPAGPGPADAASSAPARPGAALPGAP